MMDIVALCREREPAARELLRKASLNPGLDACDDAWMTASIFQTLLDEERKHRAHTHKHPTGECQQFID